MVLGVAMSRFSSLLQNSSVTCYHADCCKRRQRPNALVIDLDTQSNELRCSSMYTTNFSTTRPGNLQPIMSGIPKRGSREARAFTGPCMHAPQQPNGPRRPLLPSMHMPAQPLITTHACAGPHLTCAAQRRDGGGGHQRHAQHGRPPLRGPAPHGGPDGPLVGARPVTGEAGGRGRSIRACMHMLARQPTHAGVAMGAHGRGARRGASHAPRPRAGHAACGGARALRRLSPKQLYLNRQYQSDNIHIPSHQPGWLE